MEWATKVSIGKLKLPAPVGEVYEDLRRRLRALPMPVTVEHGAKLADLPLHHRDPFDRLLVAQAQVESLSLVSADPEIAKYDVDVIW
jgi:PIN domain nuclease of toxin-antitoxin system